MKWTEQEFLQLGRCTGTIEYQGEQLEIAFTIDLTRQDSVVAMTEPIPNCRLVLIHALHRGIEGDRRLPVCQLTGSTEDGRSLEARYVTVPRFQAGSTIVAELNLGELRIQTTDLENPASTSDHWTVEYLTKRQRGFDPLTKQHPLGKIELYGESKFRPDPDEYSGLLRIERPTSEPDLEDWLTKTHELSTKILRILSLAQGKFLWWELQLVFQEAEIRAAVVRPQKAPRTVRAEVFHYLNLQPALDLAVDGYDDELDDRTGFAASLSWFLCDTRLEEPRFLHLMVALEHLISVYSSSTPTSSPVDKQLFRTDVLPNLESVLAKLHEKGTLVGSEAEMLKSFVRGINRRPLRYRLVEMLKSYDVPYADLEQEFSQMISMRNDVVHRGLFPEDHDGSGNEVERLRNIAEELLVRIYLALLGYRGRYISPLHDLQLRSLSGP